MAEISNFSFVPLAGPHRYSDFDCGDADLNDFILTDAHLYQEMMLASTTLIIDNYKDKLVGFYSLANDNIRKQNNSTEYWDNHISENFSSNETKERMPKPAILLARLGIDKNYQSNGIGSAIIDFIIVSIIVKSISGCRFMTVDAYKNERTLSFYLKCGFNYLLNDEHKDTRRMYLDLISFRNGLRDSDDSPNQMNINLG